MDLGAIFLLLVILIPVVMFVAWPFIKHWRVQTEGGHEISSLLAERDRVLIALQELDFDNSLGKIPVEEYPVQRAVLLQRGAEVLRHLDTLTPGLSPVGQEESAERRVEAKGSVRFSDAVVQPVKLLSDDDLEELIAKRRIARKEKTAGFCPKCGKPILQSDQFCPSCGQAVN
jgi:hypothetical protein